MQILPTIDGTLDELDRCFRDPFNLFVGAFVTPVAVSSSGFINHVDETDGSIDTYGWIAGPRRARRDLRGRA